MLGDFNINYKEKANPAFKELDFITKALSLRQLISNPTRTMFRDGLPTETIIDLLFTNSEHVRETGVLDLNISDHLGIWATRKKTRVKYNKIDFKGRSYKNYRKEDFQENLRNANWDGFYNNENPNWLWDYMYNVILDNIETMCPIKTFKVDEFKEVWMTNEAIEAIRDKDRALIRARRTGREDDWAEARRLRNKVGRDIENLRADYLKNQQEANRDDPKKFLKNIASVIPG